MSPMHEFQSYFNKLGQTLALTEATNRSGSPNLSPMHNMVGWLRNGEKAIVIGNGGSAAIASHVANDLNIAGMHAMALNDASTLTCLSNDFGYENVFSKQIEWHGDAMDMLIAISSSGKSPNILTAVKTAILLEMPVVTFSGFERDNPLRTLGDMNFYVPSSEYGFVEMAHHIILHAVTDALRK